MNSDDDQYAVLRELLESGALSRKDVSEETLKLVYGGEANVPSVPTVDKNPDLSWAQLPPKVEQPKVSYDQIGVKKTTPPAVAVFADNPSKKNSRGLSFAELSNNFDRQQLQDMKLLKDMVELGLVPESELESIKGAIIRDRRRIQARFKRQPEEPRRGVDIGVALSGIAIIKWFSVILGFLGAIGGVIIATNKVDNPICLGPFTQFGEPTCTQNFEYPDVALGLGLTFNAVFFAVVFFTLGAYMEARLEQGNLSN